MTLGSIALVLGVIITVASVVVDFLSRPHRNHGQKERHQH